uniref:Uncharacterized protein n=1 Tax=Arundo donax TaxID=35708 RepID=A0A0A9DQW3_ARUDO
MLMLKIQYTNHTKSLGSADIAYTQDLPRANNLLDVNYILYHPLCYKFHGTSARRFGVMKLLKFSHGLALISMLKMLNEPFFFPCISP